MTDATPDTPKRRFDISQGSALRFVVLFGFVSLLADMTYEGARSITGPWLALMGASAAAVGFVAGLGELLGYTLRIVSGYLVDRTGRYWLLTLVGYTSNLIAVPLMAIAGRWEIAALLIVAERSGKAIRVPSRDAMLSHATSAMGRGLGFGLHEAMDRTGAMLGPLVVAGVLFLAAQANGQASSGYQAAFAILAIPALLALGTLATARALYPNPRDLEVKKITLESQRALAPLLALRGGGGLHRRRLRRLPAHRLPPAEERGDGAHPHPHPLRGGHGGQRHLRADLWPALRPGWARLPSSPPHCCPRSLPPLPSRSAPLLPWWAWSVGHRHGGAELGDARRHRRPGGRRPPRLGLWHLQHLLWRGLVPGQHAHGPALRSELDLSYRLLRGGAIGGHSLPAHGGPPSSSSTRPNDYRPAPSQAPARARIRLSQRSMPCGCSPSW